MAEVKRVGSNGQPLRNLSWAEKTKDDYQWFKDWAVYLRGNSGFNTTKNIDKGERRSHLHRLYGVYNNQFPAKWFTHVTNPLSTADPKHRGFPARIRPINYLRTNIDLLLGEFLQRPINFQVKSEKGYSKFDKALINHLNQFITDYYEQLKQSENPEAEQEPDIEAEAMRFSSEYRDNVAIRSQKKLKAIIRQYKIKRELLKCKKDYLIAGEAVTFKTLMNNGEFIFRRVSPLDMEYDRSDDITMIKDKSWAMCRFRMSVAEVTDLFYDTLKEQDYDTLDNQVQTALQSRSSFLNYANSLTRDGQLNTFHYQWTARKQVLEVTGVDPDTGEQYDFEADENYIPEPDEQVTKTWRNEIYEVWELAENLYVNPRALPFATELSYNGRTYSDTHSAPMSVMEMGLPIQILLMVVHFKLESTIAKSKDKIVILDRNAIPRKDGWTDEKFFYQSEAKGWAMIDRSQSGVDKSYNQYQVLDLTLYERIEQLIKVSEYLKQSWDDLLGISRPRKGQTAASDAVGVTNTAMVQSNIITDMIFFTFEELIEDDLNGLNELSRIADSWGIPADSWMMDEFDRELASIDSMEASLEKQKIWLEYNTIELQKLERAKQSMDMFIQNGTPMSQIFEVWDSQNMAEIKKKIIEMEQQQAQQQEAIADNAAKREEMLLEKQKDIKEFEHILDKDFMNEEYDRKEGIEELKGVFNTFTFQDGDSNDNGIPDGAEVMKIVQKRESEKDKINLKHKELEEKRAARQEQSKQAKADMAQREKERKSKEKVDLKKVAAAKTKARAASKSKK